MMLSNTKLFIKDNYIRQRLSKIRKSKGLTQQQLSEISGLSTSTISNLESGENSYTLRTLIKYAEALGYELDIEKKRDNNDSEKPT